MQRAYVVLYLVSVLLIKGSSSYLYNDTAALVRELLTDYDVRQRPVVNQAFPVNVSMTFYLISIQEFDEVAEKFSIYGLLWMTWLDEILTWDPTTHGGVYSLLFKLSDVWYPKLVLIKPHTKLNDIGDDWMTVRVISSGDTYFAPGSVFDTTCSVDVTFYPFDTQNCSLSFSTWGYFGHEVILHPLDDIVNEGLFQGHGEWDLVSTSVYRIPATTYSPDEVHFNFILKRKPAFLVINVLLPIIFMSALNLLVFVLPAESGERVSYSVTVLLALAVFMTLVGDNIPKTSEPMSVLSFYLMCLMILSTLMTVTTIINLKMYFKKGRVPKCLVSVIRILCCFPCMCKHKDNTLKNQITPAEGHNIKFVLPKDTNERSDLDSAEELEMTWLYVSFFVDKVATVIFVTSTFVVNLIFLVVLTQS